MMTLGRGVETVTTRTTGSSSSSNVFLEYRRFHTIQLLCQIGELHNGKDGTLDEIIQGVLSTQLSQLTFVINPTCRVASIVIVIVIAVTRHDSFALWTKCGQFGCYSIVEPISSLFLVEVP